MFPLTILYGLISAIYPFVSIYGISIIIDDLILNEKSLYIHTVFFITINSVIYILNTVFHKCFYNSRKVLFLKQKMYFTDVLIDIKKTNYDSDELKKICNKEKSIIKHESNNPLFMICKLVYDFVSGFTNVILTFFIVAKLFFVYDNHLFITSRYFSIIVICITLIMIVLVGLVSAIVNKKTSKVMRIAPELYLKRLVVGGFERVFEINRNFRNEGVSVRHNPEFTMMEFYCTYWTYRDQMQFTEDLLRTAAREATGSAILPYQGHEIDLEKPFDRLTPVEAILKYSPDYTAEQLADEAFLRAELVRLGEPQPDYVGLGALQMALFEETTEAKLIQPTFIIDYPTEISPLARASDANHDVTERFELFIAGRELGNGFSELNDPDDQAARFKAQADAKSHGDDEAMYYDADYIRALEYGLPPTAGCGVGIDRFIMLLTDAPTIRDVLLFPHMRPESGN